MEMSKEPCGMSEIPDHAPATVSIENQMPLDLFDAMREFIRCHPQWDQYRLMQAALAGFLFQQGCQDRAVARHYLDGLFRRDPKSKIPPSPESSMQAKSMQARSMQASSMEARSMEARRSDSHPSIVKPESAFFSQLEIQPTASFAFLGVSAAFS